MSKLDTLKALSFLQLAYNRSLSEQQLEFYVEMLKDVHPGILAVAVRKLINTSKFLPTIAEIREAANAVDDIANGCVGLDADQAWGIVQKAIKSVGQYAKPVFEDEVLAETVDHLGWKDICQTPVDDTAILRAQFRKAFETNRERRKERKAFQTAADGALQAQRYKELAGKMKVLTGKLNIDKPKEKQG